MKIVCSLELSKRLKELGVKQESYFYWWQCEEYYCSDEKCKYRHGGIETSEADNLENYSAFTASELGELLPIKLNEKYLLQRRCARNGWWIYYSNCNKEDDKNAYWSANEANARAKMLIHLLENNLMELPK